MRRNGQGEDRKRRRGWVWYLVCALLTVGGLLLVRYGRVLDNPWLNFGGMLLLVSSFGAMYVGGRRISAEDERELDELLAELETEEDTDELPLAPGEAPPDLFVMGYPSDTTYQVVPGAEELHFVRLGWGEWMSNKALDRMVEPGGSDAKIRAAMEKGFSVPWRDIERVDVTFKRCVSTQLENFGIFSMVTGGKRRRFILLSRAEELDTPARVRAFFSRVSAYTADTKRYDAQQDEWREQREAAALRAETQDPALLKKLRLLGYALPALAVLTGLTWRFLPVPYDLFGAISVALALLPMALVAAWPRWFSVGSMLELRQGEEKLVPNTVDLTTAVIVGGIFPMLGGLADFNVLNWGWGIGAAALFALVMTLLMTRGLTLKKLWLRRALIWLMLAVFSIGAVLEVNYLLDFREPETEEAVITDMQISDGRSKSYDVYFDGDRSYSVAKEDYEAMDIGDTVVLVEHTGALGIRYVDVWTTSDWYGD